MITTFTLIVNRKGGVRTAKRRTSLKPGEVSVNIRLNLPESLFTKPQLNAEITIPQSAVKPNIINAEIKDNIKEILQTVLGADLKIEIFQHNES